MSVPAIPVDEALELFLALAFPNGLPEGIDRASLVEQMRARIAGDRPEWAAASYAGNPPGAPGPVDPHEQYLEERRREADEHRAQRQEEARVEEARAELLRRLLARKREADADGPGQPLQIRPDPRWTIVPTPPPRDAPALGIGLGPALQLGAPVADAPARPEMSSRPPAKAVPSLPVSGPELARVLRELAPDEQLAVLRGVGESRRALLKRREDLLADRRPSRRADRGEALGFSDKPEAGEEGPTLKDAPARRDRLRLEL